MKTDKLNPTVSVTVAGQSHQIRWDKAALFELGAFPEASKDIKPGDHFATWRRFVLYLFCMLQGNHGYDSPKALAAAVLDDEAEGIIAAINEAITRGTGGEGDADDPLSKSGRSQDADSD